MSKRNNYITDTEYEQALYKYYNGLDNFTDHIEYKESLLDKIEYDNSIVKEFLEEDEQYTELHKGYIVTSKARVYNIRFRRFLTPKFYNAHIYVYCGYNYYKLESIFEEQGWEYDKLEILKYHLKRKWPVNIMDNCKYCKKVNTAIY